MKEEYITEMTLNKKAIEWQRELSCYTNKHKNFHFNPKKSALLILDMQRFFLSPFSHAYVPSAKYIVPKIKEVMMHYLKNNLLVVLTRHSIKNEKEVGIMSKWWNDIIIDNDSSSGIIDELYSKDAIIIRKTRYSAFFNTNLDKILKKNKIKQVVICGILTHLCCETTARDAFMRDYEVYFTIDGTATYTEKFHQATLLNLSHGFAILIRMDEIIEQFNSLFQTNL
jgi:isochorismate hydrolase